MIGNSHGARGQRCCQYVAAAHAARGACSNPTLSLTSSHKKGKRVRDGRMRGCRYRLASAGVAISDSPTGPFTYLRSFRPHGQECRDMTIFKVCSLSSLIVHLYGWSLHQGIAMRPGLPASAYNGMRNLCQQHFPHFAGEFLCFHPSLRPQRTLHLVLGLIEHPCMRRMMTRLLT